jgi:RimJ/RimL family protein N-acetyltransferase
MACDWPTPEELGTERLVLEPLRIGHAAEMVAVLADRAMYEFTGGEPPAEADLVARYTRQISRASWLNWILRLRSSGEALGTVQATLKDEHTAELAWLVSSRFQGKGYAREGAAATLDWLSRNGIELFVAHIPPDHAASTAVARRLGFTSTPELKNGEIRWELRNRCQN